MRTESASLFSLCTTFVLISLSMGYAASGQPPIVPKTYDFASTIDAYAQRHDLPREEAGEQALRQLLTPLGGPGLKFRHQSLGDDQYKVWATENQHSGVTGVANWLQHGKQICIELRWITVSEETRKSLHQRYAGKWKLSCYDRQGPLVRVPSDTQPLGQRAEGERLTTVTQTVKHSPGRLVQLTADEAAAAQQQSTSSSPTLRAPKITVLPGQTAAVKDATQRPFVVSVKPIEGEQATGLQPIVEVLEEGLVINLLADLHGEDQILLNSEITSSKITEVDTFTFQPAEGMEDMTVQMPKQHVKKVSLSKVIDDRATLLIDPHFAQEVEEKRWWRSMKSQVYTLVLVTPKIICEEPVRAGEADAETLGDVDPQPLEAALATTRGG